MQNSNNKYYSPYMDRGYVTGLLFPRDSGAIPDASHILENDIKPRSMYRSVYDAISQDRTRRVPFTNGGLWNSKFGCVSVDYCVENTYRRPVTPYVATEMSSIMVMNGRELQVDREHERYAHAFIHMKACNMFYCTNCTCVMTPFERIGHMKDCFRMTCGLDSEMAFLLREPFFFCQICNCYITEHYDNDNEDMIDVRFRSLKAFFDHRDSPRHLERIARCVNLVKNRSCVIVHANGFDVTEGLNEEEILNYAAPRYRKYVICNMRHLQYRIMYQNMIEDGKIQQLIDNPQRTLQYFPDPGFINLHPVLEASRELEFIHWPQFYRETYNPRLDESDKSEYADVVKNITTNHFY